MKSKDVKNSARLALIISFCAALFALFVLLLVLPKHAGELSPLEFRSLADYPFRGKSAETIAGELVKGEASANVDSFLEDHFPGRSFFIALNSYSTRLTGRNADQGVVRGKNGRLFDAPQVIDLDRARTNIERIDSFAAENGLDSCIVIVPSSALVCTGSLPALHLDYNDADLISFAQANSSSYVPDLLALYGSDADPERLFYRTDHHWTMSGAYECYRLIAEKLGLTPVDRSGFLVERYNFYGSFYREAGLWLTAPDGLEIWRCEALDSMPVTIGPEEFAEEHTGVYDPEKLKAGEVDRYAAYLYSNNALTVIENPEGNGETAILVKDSYGNSIAPLLAMNYSRIVMIDTRYYRGKLPMPSELAAEYGATKLIVVLGTDSMVSDIQISTLR
ncbi:MAG: hypothetical protein IKG85_02710 [Clostridia bacterium]|nr:hypothetical protein [Clostridia bacterium]